MRRANPVARLALPGMFGPAARVRLRPGRGGISGPGPRPRRGVEGARPPPARGADGRDRLRHDRLPGRPRDRLRPAGRRPQRAARPPPRGAPRPRARATLGAARDRDARPCADAEAAARPHARRAAAKRPGRIRGSKPGGEQADPRGRRLHDRCDRISGSVCPEASRCQTRRCGHLRARRAVNTIVATGHGDHGRAGCDSR
jgi:hypothetical protein